MFYFYLNSWLKINLINLWTTSELFLVNNKTLFKIDFVSIFLQFHTSFSNLKTVLQKLQWNNNWSEKFKFEKKKKNWNVKYKMLILIL